MNTDNLINRTNRCLHLIACDVLLILLNVMTTIDID